MNPPTRARTRLTTLLSGALLLLSAAGASAQPQRYIEAQWPGEQQWHDRLVPVIAPHAQALVVNDAAQAVVLLNDADEAHDLVVIPLDQQGQPGEPAGHVDLKALGDRTMRGLRILSHPEKPLIYLWQDVVVGENDALKESAAHEHLNHLLVYELTSKHQLKLVQSTGRGEAYAFGRRGGGLTLDWPRRRLYVPNTYGQNGGDQPHPQAAYLTLNDAGHVVIEDGAAALTGQVGPWNLDAHTWPNDYLPGSDTTTLIAGGHNLWAWDMTEDRYRFGHYALAGATVQAGSTRFCMHPDLPVVYAFFHYGRKVFRIRHADGFPTLLPQRMTIEQTPPLFTGPVVTADGKYLVIGADNERILFITLDAQGRLTDEIQTMQLSGGYQRKSALAYSAKLDRVYAQTEKPVSPPDAETE